jgi:hypothetical protein
LFGISETLEGHREKIKEDEKNSKKVCDINSPEYAVALCGTFVKMQVPLQNERETSQSLVGKTYRDIETENKFESGDAERGEEAFK